MTSYSRHLYIIFPTLITLEPKFIKAIEEKPIESKENVEICSIACSQDSKYFIPYGLNNKINIWELNSGKTIKTINYSGIGINFLIYTNNEIFFSSYNDSNMEWGNINKITIDNESEYGFSTIGGIFQKIILTKDKNILIAFYNNNTDMTWPWTGEIKVWNVNSGKNLFNIKAFEGAINDMEISSNEKYIFTLGRDINKINQLKILDLLTGEIIHSQNIDDNIYKINFSKNGYLVCSKYLESNSNTKESIIIEIFELKYE